DHAGGVPVEHTGRKGMQSKLPVIVYNGMARIGASLKSYNDIRLSGEHICDLSLALVSPVGSNYCFDHNTISSSCLSLIIYNLLSVCQTLISAFTPRRSLRSSSTGFTVFARKVSVCSFALP